MPLVGEGDEQLRVKDLVPGIGNAWEAPVAAVLVPQWGPPLLIGQVLFPVYGWVAVLPVIRHPGDI